MINPIQFGHVGKSYTHIALDRQIPTVLSYIDGEEYHGTQAKSQLVRNPQNTVAYFRDYLGKEYVYRGRQTERERGGIERKGC